MARLHIRSFQGRIFIAILAVVLVPAGIAVAGGLVTLQRIGSGSGTLGAWDAVAQTGRTLLKSLDDAGVENPAVKRAAAEHREALSESVRLSRLYAFVAERFLSILPVAALLAGILITALALLTARKLSVGFARPITELVGWTQRIARQEPLPSEQEEDGTDLEEFRVLRTALRDMAGELEVARRQEVETARMRSWTALARRVAHEIKNPLTPMRMAAATLSRDATGRSAEAAGVLLEEIDRLDGLARTFSQYGKMPEGPRSDVDLEELVRSLAVQHASEGVPIHVHGGAGLMVNAHYDALERALRNLVVNAVEAQEGSDAAAVDVHLERDGDEAVVRVEDRGPGVPEELRADVWNPDVTTKRAGTGLGLAIVHQTVQMHGGSVSLANRPEGGAAFTVRLPLVATTG